MRVDENTIVIYYVYDGEQTINEFNTREEAFDFINDRDDHGFDTILWSIIPEIHHEE